MERESENTSIPLPASGLLAALGEVRHYARKTLIIREGTEGSDLYVLLSGRIRIFTEDEEGHSFIIGSFGTGTLFGEGALDGGPRTASVEAISDSECAVIPYAVLLQKMRDDPAFSLSLIGELIRRSRSSTRKLKSLALESVYQRLRQLFEEDGVMLDGRKVLGPALSQQEIANRLGASRDMITRILRELTKGGYVQVGRGCIEQLKPLPRAW